MRRSRLDAIGAAAIGPFRPSLHSPSIPPVDGLDRIMTPRLRLRPVKLGDAAETARLVTADVSEQLASWPAPMSTAEIASRIRTAEAQRKRREAVNLAILSRRDETLMGWLGLWRDEASPERARLGYWLGRDFRGQGQMREALQHALAPVAAFLSARIVEATVKQENGPSRRLLESLGFESIERLDLHIPTRGRMESCIRYETALDARQPLTPRP